MADINDLLQEFWNSSNGAVGTSFFAMRSSCLLGILHKCFNSLELEVTVCFCHDYSFLRLLSTLLITMYRQTPTIIQVSGLIATSHLMPVTESA